MDNETNHVIRTLKRALGQANKNMGKQGETICRLRGELARTREENSKIQRGEIRRLERDNESLKQMMLKQREINKQLRQQLRSVPEEVIS